VATLKREGEPLTSEGMGAVPQALRERSIRIANQIVTKIREIEHLDPVSCASVFGMNVFGAYAGETFTRMRRRMVETVAFMEKEWLGHPIDKAVEEVIAILDKAGLDGGGREQVQVKIERHYG